MTTSHWFVAHRPLAWTLLFVNLAWGIQAYLAMPQRHDPIIPIRNAVILTEYPGATALEVERQVTIAVERRVTEIDSVKRVMTQSRPGLSVVFVELWRTCLA
jgi:multidrug efflux pump